MAARTGLPEILAGPILRRVDPNGASIWLATQKSHTLVVHVYDSTGAMVAKGTAATTAIGDHLNVVLVTAVPPTPTQLGPGVHYTYDLDFEGEQLTFAQALGGDLSAICYAPDSLPSFALPPQNLAQLSLLHASCRKAGSPQLDALPLVDGLIGAARSAATSNADFAVSRPHQLWLTGDQIYADDLADAWLAMCIDAAGWLMGKRLEPYPAFVGPSGGPGNAPTPWPRLASGSPFYQLSVQGQPSTWPGGNPWADPNFPGVGARGSLAWNAGLTVDPPKTANISAATSYNPSSHTKTARNHLFALGEFYASYLLSFSPALWPPMSAAGLPDVPPSPYDDGGSAVAAFGAGTAAVRRALANIPTYMVLDDHEVSDDLLMNRAWCTRVLGTAPSDTLGRRLLRNAFIAYAIFQDMGNQPANWVSSGNPQTDPPGAALLSALGNAREMNISADPTPAMVGVPSNGVPNVPAPGGQARLYRGGQAFSWNYNWRATGWPFEVVALDCRTARGYGAGDVDPPQLLSDQPAQPPEPGPPTFPSALDSQLDAPPAGTLLSVVIVQTPLFGLRWVEDLFEKTTNIKRSFDNDAEAWGLNRYGFEVMLARLAARNTYSVLLSGDVHYSFAAGADYYGPHPLNQTMSGPSAKIVQLTSSSMKNEDWKTHLVDTLGFTGIGDIPFELVSMRNPDAWGGLAQPTPMTNSVAAQAALIANPKVRPSVFESAPVVVPVDTFAAFFGTSTVPDWRYRIEFVAGTQTPGNPVAISPLPSLSGSLSTSIPGVVTFLKECANAASAFGTEVVGVNNICRVTFTASDPASAHVQQTVFWRAADPGTLTTSPVQTHFDVSLAIGPDPFSATGS
jgi:hypothetical protein